MELYHQGYVPALLLTGGPSPEADAMCRHAIELGAPPEHLMVEAQSTSTFGNVVNSLALLREAGLLASMRAVLLVSSPWHMRRVQLTAAREWPSSLRVVCCPTLEGCTGATWMNSDACRDTVLTELRLLQSFVDAGILAILDRP